MMRALVRPNRWHRHGYTSIHVQKVRFKLKIILRLGFVHHSSTFASISKQLCHVIITPARLELPLLGLVVSLNHRIQIMHYRGQHHYCHHQHRFIIELLQRHFIMSFAPTNKCNSTRLCRAHISRDTVGNFHSQLLKEQTWQYEFKDGIARLRMNDEMLHYRGQHH